jgi:hypothetical protein
MMPENWNSEARSVSRLKLGKHGPMATNACATIEHLDATVSRRFMPRPALG